MFLPSVGTRAEHQQDEVVSSSWAVDMQERRHVTCRVPLTLQTGGVQAPDPIALAVSCTVESVRPWMRLSIHCCKYFSLAKRLYIAQVLFTICVTLDAVQTMSKYSDVRPVICQ